MKQQIQELIQQHKERKEEVFEHLQELSNLLDTDLNSEEKELIRNSIFYLDKERYLRSVFISELESLIV